ncbi:MAG TPA: hypothetical protein PKM48_07060 [Parvularculaceae bacterium]|nr:hypothetical protein [Parvularculaceae bacterium]
MGGKVLSSEERPAARSKAALNIVPPAAIEKMAGAAKARGSSVDLDSLAQGERARPFSHSFSPSWKPTRPKKS